MATTRIRNAVLLAAIAAMVTAVAAPAPAPLAETEHVTIADRDHFTVLSRMALSKDPARRSMLDYMRRHLSPAETAE